MRREAVHERGVGDVGARAVRPEELHRHRTALAGHLADDDVGLVLDAVVVHAFQRLVAQPVVVVDVHDELAPGRGGADVTGLSRPARGFLVDDVHVRVRGGDLVQPRRGGIGGAVVDEDGFVLVVRQALPQERGNAVLDVLTRVVHRDDDADLDGHAASPKREERPRRLIALGSRARQIIPRRHRKRPEVAPGRPSPAGTLPLSRSAPRSGGAAARRPNAGGADCGHGRARTRKRLRAAPRAVRRSCAPAARRGRPADRVRHIPR